MENRRRNFFRFFMLFLLAFIGGDEIERHYKTISRFSIRKQEDGSLFYKPETGIHD